MTNITFYDVKERKKITLPQEEIKKTTYSRTLKDGRIQIRYAFRAQINDRSFTKFCSKTDWDDLKVPIE
jgi:hypothetical protein